MAEAPDAGEALGGEEASVGEATPAGEDAPAGEKTPEAPDGEDMPTAGESPDGQPASDAPRPARTGISKGVFAIVIVAVALAAYAMGQFAFMRGGPVVVPWALTQFDEGAQTPAREFALRMGEMASALDANGYYGVDIDSATQNGAQALLGATDDAYAEYYDVDDYRSYLNQVSGEYPGIGVVLANFGGYTVVVQVYDGSPAQAGGVQPGDVIVSIDGEQGPWTAKRVVKAIERGEGERVDIVFLRPTSESLAQLASAVEVRAGLDQPAAQEDDETQPLVELAGQTYDAQLAYERFEVPNIESRMMGTVGYVRLYMFTQNAASQVAQAIDQLLAQGATGLVLDLRGNGGGMVDQAVELVSQFVDDGIVYRQITSKGANDEPVRRQAGATVCDLPLVLLADADTASASEITAAALKDHDRATIVGQTTYGKGSIQEVRQLSFGGALKFTIAEYLSPGGTPINRAGITPDVQVDAGAGDVMGQPGRDAQLDAALELLAQGGPSNGAGTAS